MTPNRSPLTRTLAVVLRQARKQAHMSYREAVEASGVSLSQLQRIEKAERDVDMDQLSRLANAYGMRASQLLREAEQMVITLGLGESGSNRDAEIATLERDAQ